MGQKLAKETEMEQPVGAEGNPGEWCALEAKQHLGFVFFSLSIFIKEKNQHLKNDINLLWNPFEDPYFVLCL